MSCLPCGKVTDADRVVVSYYKKIFETTGKVFYAYRLSKNKPFNFIEKQYFNQILTQIKTNFDKGAEYFHIQEFKGN